MFLTAYIAPQLTPYIGNFPSKEIILDSQIPAFIGSFANFDGVNYLDIALHGYHQYLTSFFPLLPVLIYLLSFMTGNYLISGLIIANLSLLFSLYLINHWFKPGIWFYLILLTFPTAFFFGSIYTESLFLLLLLLTLRYPIFGFFAGLTRINGLFTAILIDRKYLFLPIAGLLVYCFFLLTKFNDPFLFFNNVSNFGVQRSSHLILLPQVYYRYLKIFTHANLNPQYLIALLEFILFNFFSLILFLDLKKNLSLIPKNPHRLSLNLFSWCNLLLPTLTGSFSSIPRYALLSVSVFFYLSEIKSAPFKIWLTAFFAIIQTILLIYFVQGHFIA